MLLASILLLIVAALIIVFDEERKYGDIVGVILKVGLVCLLVGFVLAILTGKG